MIEAQAQGSGLLTFLIREEMPTWQVRNAAIVSTPNGFQIGPLRNEFSREAEIVISPMTPSSASFVHKLRNITKATVQPTRGDGWLRVQVAEVNGAGEVELIAPKKPQSVKGALNWNWKEGIAIITVQQPGEITITV